MSGRSVTVMGGGNTAFAAAANLTLQGHEVTLFELPEFADSIRPIEQSRTINLLGVAGQGPARIAQVTTDAQRALAASDLALLIVPAYAHKAFAEACAPYLTPDHTVVIMPGTLGSLEWSKVLGEAGRTGVTLAEVDTAPYVCRKTGPDEATIWGVVSALGIGVLPARETARVQAILDPLFPGITTYPDVMACGLSAINPVMHPAGVLMNAGRIEYSRGEFYFYEEGVTPSVVQVIMRVDEERRNIGRSLGYDLIAVEDAFHQAGFGPKGDLWATVNGSRMLTQVRAPGTVNNRWMTEDLPYGLATWSQVAGQYGIDTPTMRAIIELGSIVIGFDALAQGRGVEDLGIDGMDREELKVFLETGVRR
ncbi:MAG: NAD/NADP octopine/nopaline dehydrogenase family protein [Chloroflexi bacterium]|nr:NAD/NADP octopine/nopaline dehydrogenase family protein [Chloroflexota bacterium]